MNTQLITQEKKKDSLLEFIETIKNGWEMVLPKVCTPERFARVALTCLRKNQKLAQAVMTTEGRLSLSSCFMKCAELGIEPDGRRAYLIPYKNEIQLIIDYKGLAELAMRSGYISNIHADKVCENDIFEYDIGEIKTHKIDFKKERGDAYAYYAIVTFKDGTKKCEVMSKKEIDAIRRRSKSANNGPWVTDYDEMAKKTVFRRLSKWIPQSPEMQTVFDLDDDNFNKTEQEPTNLSTFAAHDRYKALDLNQPSEEIPHQNLSDNEDMDTDELKEVPSFDPSTGEIIQEDDLPF